MEDEKIDLHWRMFTARIILGMSAMVGGQFAAHVFEHRANEFDRSHAFQDWSIGAHWVAAGAVLLPCLIFVCATFPFGQRWFKDEFERRVERAAAAYAGYLVVGWMMWMNLYPEFLGSMPDDVTRIAFSPLSGPGALLILHTGLAQFTRYRFARGRLPLGIEKRL